MRDVITVGLCCALPWLLWCVTVLLSVALWAKYKGYDYTGPLTKEQFLKLEAQAHKAADKVARRGWGIGGGALE